jgi:hypothetical protein
VQLAIFADRKHTEQTHIFQLKIMYTNTSFTNPFAPNNNIVMMNYPVMKAMPGDDDEDLDDDMADEDDFEEELLVDEDYEGDDFKDADDLDLDLDDDFDDLDEEDEFSNE